LATDQEVLGSTPSRRTKKEGKMKISLQKSVIYFFVIVLIILFLITLII